MRYRLRPTGLQPCLCPSRQSRSVPRSTHSATRCPTYRSPSARRCRPLRRSARLCGRSVRQSAGDAARANENLRFPLVPDFPPRAVNRFTGRNSRVLGPFGIDVPGTWAGRPSHGLTQGWLAYLLGWPSTWTMIWLLPDATVLWRRLHEKLPGCGLSSTNHPEGRDSQWRAEGTIFAEKSPRPSCESDPEHCRLRRGCPQSLGICFPPGKCAGYGSGAQARRPPQTCRSRISRAMKQPAEYRTAKHKPSARWRHCGHGAAPAWG